MNIVSAIVRSLHGPATIRLKTPKTPSPTHFQPHVLFLFPRKAMDARISKQMHLHIQPPNGLVTCTAGSSCRSGFNALCLYSSGASQPRTTPSLLTETRGGRDEAFPCHAFPQAPPPLPRAGLGSLRGGCGFLCVKAPINVRLLAVTGRRGARRPPGERSGAVRA